MSKCFGYYLIPEKITGIQPQNVSNTKFGDKDIMLYWYTRKQLKKKIDHGYVEV